MQEFPLKYVYKRYNNNNILVYNCETEQSIFRLELIGCLYELPDECIKRMIRGMLSGLTGYAPLPERFDIRKWGE